MSSNYLLQVLRSWQIALKISPMRCLEHYFMAQDAHYQSCS